MVCGGAFAEFCGVRWFVGFVGLVCFLGWWVLVGLCVCRRCFLGGLFVCCCFGGFGGYGCGLVAWMWFEFGCVCSVVLRVGCLVLFGFRCLMGVWCGFMVAIGLLELW